MSAVTATQAGAAAVRQRERAAVLANQLRLDWRWGQACEVYNAFIRPDPPGRDEIAAIQEQALQLEPGLLRIPPAALHLTAISLLGLYDEYDRPRTELWAEHGPRWLVQIAALAAATPSFDLRFRNLVATDAAIIAVADEPNGLTALREAAASVIQRQGDFRYEQPIVHMTLFRYRVPLRDPAALLAWLADAGCQARIRVTELFVAREHTYSFLGYDELRRLPLGGAAGPRLTRVASHEQSGRARA
jgi:hypothetical protein